MEILVIAIENDVDSPNLVSTNDDRSVVEECLYCRKRGLIAADRSGADHNNFLYVLLLSMVVKI